MNGEYYVGDLNDKGQPHGNGAIYSSDGYYVGGFFDGQRHGQGKYVK